MPDLDKLKEVMGWVVGLACAAFWLWGAMESYQGAGLGGVLMWLALGSLLCMLMFYVGFTILVENLEGTLQLLLTLTALGSFIWLVKALWDVRF
jgi:hypothetical protein